MGELHESSMNFDQENVRPFLERVCTMIDSGFGSKEVDEIVAMSESMQLDEEHDVTFSIVYEGRETLFQVKVFMDDIEAPDMYFFGPEALVEKIDDEMDAFNEELGI